MRTASFGLFTGLFRLLFVNLQSQWASIAPFRFASKHPEKSTYKISNKNLNNILKRRQFLEISTQKAHPRLRKQATEPTVRPTSLHFSKIAHNISTLRLIITQLQLESNLSTMLITMFKTGEKDVDK